MNRASEDHGSLELMEEAFALLRAVSAPAWVAYYLGSLPCLLAFLFFWSDMARSAFAEGRLFPGSLLLALSFVWMKLWQAVFARHLHAHLCREEPPRWQMRWLLRTATVQALLQVPGLFLLPAALALAVPFGWVVAFLNNATLFSSAPDADLPATWKRSWRQACLWPMQNHNGLLILGVCLLLVFFNVYTGLLSVPFLLAKFLGIESVFTLSPWAAMNSTLTAAVAGLTYLCCDPFIKAFYVLRCFYGESMATGEDLKAGLRGVAGAKFAAVRSIAVAFLLLSAAGSAVAAADPADALEKPAVPPRPASESVTPVDLDRSIDRVIQRREYTWRMPREAVEARERSGWVAWLQDQMQATAKALGRWVVDVWNALRNLWSRSGVPAPDGSALALGVSALLLVLILGLLALLGRLLFRLWLGRLVPTEVTAEALPATPDVADESVGAERMPEDGWVRLGRELLSRGDLRLALRAFYLATLAHLAERSLIGLARFKSNHDYEQELARRGHALRSLLPLFSENLGVFERVWYGQHTVTPQMVHEFSLNVERMKVA